MHGGYLQHQIYPPQFLPRCGTPPVSRIPPAPGRSIPSCGGGRTPHASPATPGAPGDGCRRGTAPAPPAGRTQVSAHGHPKLPHPRGAHRHRRPLAVTWSPSHTALPAAIAPERHREGTGREGDAAAAIFTPGASRDGAAPFCEAASARLLRAGREGGAAPPRLLLSLPRTKGWCCTAQGGRGCAFRLGTIPTHAQPKGQRGGEPQSWHMPPGILSAVWPKLKQPSLRC